MKTPHERVEMTSAVCLFFRFDVNMGSPFVLLISTHVY